MKPFSKFLLINKSLTASQAASKLVFLSVGRLVIGVLRKVRISKIEERKERGV